MTQPIGDGNQKQILYPTTKVFFLTCTQPERTEDDKQNNVDYQPITQRKPRQSNPTAVTGVTIEPSEAELPAGYSMKLTATVLPENATNKNVVYSVDDESILSVDQDGNITGLSLGIATVTVTTEDGGFTASAEITVISPSCSARYFFEYPALR